LIAHIISQNGKQKLAALATIRYTPNDIDTARNCLFMLNVIEDAFDALGLCILYQPLQVSYFNTIFFFFDQI
jgi:hypothetical protein